MLVNKNQRLRFFEPWMINLSTRAIFGDPRHPARLELTRRVRAQWMGPERPCWNAPWFARGGHFGSAGLAASA